MANESEPDTPDAELAELDEDEVQLGAFDLDGDGKVSPVEDARATLGLIDARLEQVAEEGGTIGKIADVAHHVVDRMDND
ncbi:hypothetical protein [Ilumatobacter sp.]|uniref:hypothetical protein n=1 Tax=Ilumatobacter sp. TaxID=1967498 RepID=UPI003C6043F5